jgi:hypothetical protein
VRRVRALAAAALTTGLLAGLAPAQAAPQLLAPTAVAQATSTKYRGSAKSYRLFKEDAKVVRWNPCDAIHYRVNTRYAPRGALADTKKAVSRVAAETGMKFVYDGSTSVIPSSTSKPNAELVIAWSRKGKGKSRSDYLPGGGVIGVGGWAARWDVDARGRITTPEIYLGYVVLDTASNDLPGGFADRASGTRGALLQHELAHAVGLDHTKDRSQIMYPSIGRYSSFGAGDHAGLQKVGRPAGCIKQPRARSEAVRPDGSQPSRTHTTSTTA